MSGADKLKEKIITEANSQVEIVLEEARQRAEQIIARGEQEASDRRKKMLNHFHAQADERRRRAQTIAGLDARKAILSAKEKMVEDTFSQALARLRKVENKAYQDLVFPLIISAVQSGNEEIICSAHDREYFTPEFVDKVNQALTREGKQGKLTLSDETREVNGGFILRAGDVELNNSFDSNLRMQRDQLEPDVAAILFNE